MTPEFGPDLIKWNCPTCKDWFHMPWKYCKCETKVVPIRKSIWQKIKDFVRDQRKSADKYLEKILKENQ